MRVRIQNFGIFFGYLVNVRHARPALKLVSKGFQPRRVANGIHLDSPVMQIFHIPGQAQLRGNVLGEKTKTNSLDSAAYVKTFGQNIDTRGAKKISFNGREIVAEVLRVADLKVDGTTPAA